MEEGEEESGCTRVVVVVVVMWSRGGEEGRDKRVDVREESEGQGMLMCVWGEGNPLWSKWSMCTCGVKGMQDDMSE